MPKNTNLSVKPTPSVPSKAAARKMAPRPVVTNTVDDLPALDYSEDEMSYELVDAINQRHEIVEADIKTKQVFGR